MESYTVPVQIISKRSYVTTMSAIQGCTAVIDSHIQLQRADFAGIGYGCLVHIGM